MNANIAYKSNFDKKVFLDLNPSYYTINLTTLYSYDEYKEFIKELNIKKDIYVFEFGDDEKTLMTKVLFGVFKSYKEALLAVDKLPQVMKNLWKIARDLWTKGLMPNPKAGTVSSDIVKTIKEIKKGKME